MSGKGFVKVDRSITDWRWWGNTTAMAIWLYILVNANWSDGFWNYGETTVRRGELITSQIKIASDLHLDRKTVNRYLKLFENDQQIVLNVTNRYTRIYVVNYSTFQAL